MCTLIVKYSCKTIFFRGTFVDKELDAEFEIVDSNNDEKLSLKELEEGFDHYRDCDIFVCTFGRRYNFKIISSPTFEKL